MRPNLLVSLFPTIGQTSSHRGEPCQPGIGCWYYSTVLQSPRPILIGHGRMEYHTSITINPMRPNLLVSLFPTIGQTSSHRGEPCQPGIGCWYYSTILQSPRPILIGHGRMEYHTSITMINSDWAW